MPDDGKLKVKDTVPHVEKTSTNNVKTVPSSKSVIQPSQPSQSSQPQKGVTTAQWTVIGLLLLLLVLELVLHPTFQSKVLAFFKAFKPAPNSTPANTPAVTSTEDIGGPAKQSPDDIGTGPITPSTQKIGGSGVSSF